MESLQPKCVVVAITLIFLHNVLFPNSKARCLQYLKGETIDPGRVRHRTFEERGLQFQGGHALLFRKQHFRIPEWGHLPHFNHGRTHRWKTCTQDVVFLAISLMYFHDRTIPGNLATLPKFKAHLIIVPSCIRFDRDITNREDHRNTRKNELEKKY